MSLSPPQPLDARYQLEPFECGKPALTDWLLRHARQAQGSGSARTFVVRDGDRVAGYYSLTVGQIDTLDAPERIRRGMGQYPIPLVILARLAVDIAYQGRGLGISLLQDAIRRTIAMAQQAGIRALLTHPIDADAEAFYRRFGFESTLVNERQLILLLKDARRYAAAPRRDDDDDDDDDGDDEA
ncbi:GNAT family N-acetyltransferase [Lamprobacter modestohalophilus]|uniref:GNAT family N-acetyltransferase n=1 Tax=Lamprobacter modestohalophilus TaxID=1064514 RepID=UPI002ADEACD4|nr:GNAT family N-acetyltransferase [Lamprobacter modestohalophilus]MEA1049882.1 GNAT family N-acetyltransferase [Lamprobacter modestohalophilus]